MKHQSALRALLLASVLAFAPAAMAQTGERFLIAEVVNPNPQGDVLEVAAATGQFTRFLDAVEAAGYAETLRGEGPFTIFAPTDEAFAEMNQREVARLMDPRNREELLAILAYHVVPGRVTTQTLGGRTTRPESSTGHRVEIDASDGLRINDQLVVMQDIEASNGVIQGINTVLAPPTLVASR
ncbi:fasciclin domain-containing protein [Vitreimonas flagellata]|uniref:fasciclin domain-containing protein n=1 Tax=Vitreimonas flagellata TaxID=2560861 RepID=UPI001075093C|nr:fasciclin domain-containing protein [Vitreimonas flagellata]